MSHYSDAEDTISNSGLMGDEEQCLRKRRLWDPENESITSEIKELLDDDDVNSLVRDRNVFSDSLFVIAFFRWKRRISWGALFPLHPKMTTFWIPK